MWIVGIDTHSSGMKRIAFCIVPCKWCVDQEGIESRWSKRARVTISYEGIWLLWCSIASRYKTIWSIPFNCISASCYETIESIKLYGIICSSCYKAIIWSCFDSIFLSSSNSSKICCCNIIVQSSCYKCPRHLQTSTWRGIKADTYSSCISMTWIQILSTIYPVW